MDTSINDASVYDDNFTLLTKIRSLQRRVEALEAQGGSGGSYTLPTASATVKGGVKIGSGLQMNGETLSTTGGGSSYELPIASASTLGGVKVGNNLSIDANGVLSASGGGGSYTLPVATAEVLGGVKIGDNLSIDANGVLSGKGVVIDTHFLPSNQVGFWNYSEGFLFGNALSIAVDNAKDYTTPLTFVNDSDSTDTKTLYIQNSSKWGNTRGYLTFAEGVEYVGSNSYYVPLFVYDYGEGLTIANAWNQGGYNAKCDTDLRLFDTASQSGVDSVGYGRVTQHNTGAYVGIDNQGRYKLTQAYGNITEIKVQIEDGDVWKDYTWTGTIALTDLFNTDEYAYLSGTWYCIK